MRGRKDLKDYQPSHLAKGGYVYTGEYHVPVLKGRQLLYHKLLLCIITIAQALCVYVMGRADSPGFRQLYVTLPFLALVYFAGRGVVAAFSLFTWKDAMTRRRYQASRLPLEQSQRILPFLCAALILSELVYFMLGGLARGEGLVLVMAFLLTLTSVLARRVLARCACVKQAQGSSPDAETRLGEPVKIDNENTRD